MFYFINSFIWKYIFGTTLCQVLFSALEIHSELLECPRSKLGDINVCASCIFGRWYQESPVGEWGSGTVTCGANKRNVFQQVKHWTTGALSWETWVPGKQWKIHSSELLHSKGEGAGVFILLSAPIRDTNRKETMLAPGPLCKSESQQLQKAVRQIIVCDKRWAHVDWNDELRGYISFLGLL